VGLVSSVAIRSKAALVKRERRFGVFSLLLAAIMFGVFAAQAEGRSARMIIDAGREDPLPALVISVGPTAIVLGVLVLAIAAVQFTRGFGSRSLLALGGATAMFVFSFLAWAAADGSLSLVGLLRNTLFAATPIAFGALAGVLCERAGVINIAIEGQFLAAAFTGAVVGSVAGNPWIGLIGGILAGLLIAGMLAGLSITFKADQIVSGVVLIVFATGLTSFLTTQVLQRTPGLNSPPRFGSFAIPVLSDIPILGPLLFIATPLTYAMFIAVAWLRSVGEKPRAADTVGIPVIATRWKAVLLGGVAAGMGGAWFTLDAVGSFSREMTGGRGFIALAAMLVGRYSPVGAFGAALLFGFATAMASSLQLLDTGVPSSLLLTIPYVVTIFVVAGLIGRLRPPAANGTPYEKD
jgi:ABC-type uncharacterized transport system permease subunit